MKTGAKALLAAERGLLLSGLVLLVFVAVAHIHRLTMFRSEIATFEARQRESAKGSAAEMEILGGPNRNAGPPQAAGIESSHPQNQPKLYRANLGDPVESLAVLRIPALHLEVPVLDGTDEVTLNRGVGRIASTALPGQGGNIGIAGHRDGFFRRLKDVRTGDAIELATMSGTDTYVVDRIGIVSPTDVAVLQPRTKDSVTLVTCYPFYFVGPAPRRFVVQASLKE